MVVGSVYVVTVVSVAVIDFPRSKPGKPTIVHMRGGPVLHFPSFIGEDLAFQILARESDPKRATLDLSQYSTEELLKLRAEISKGAEIATPPRFRLESYERPTSREKLELISEALRRGLLPATGQTLPALLDDLRAIEDDFFAKERRDFVLLWLGIAVCPLIAIYLAGLGVVWIRRGFKGES